MLSQWQGYHYQWQPQLDIQLHNTYFVVQPLLLTTLLFLPVATVVTGARVLVGAFRHFGANALLVALAIVWTLLGLLVAVRWALS